jgi:hypothetical protein
MHTVATYPNFFKCAAIYDEVFSSWPDNSGAARIVWYIVTKSLNLLLIALSRFYEK